MTQSLAILANQIPTYDSATQEWWVMGGRVVALLWLIDFVMCIGILWAMPPPLSLGVIAVVLAGTFGFTIVESAKENRTWPLCVEAGGFGRPGALLRWSEVRQIRAEAVGVRGVLMQRTTTLSALIVETDTGAVAWVSRAPLAEVEALAASLDATRQAES